MKFFIIECSFICKKVFFLNTFFTFVESYKHDYGRKAISQTV